MTDFEDYLTRLEQRITELDSLDEPTRTLVFEVLDGVDATHRFALRRLEDAVDAATLQRLRADPALAWLLDAYGIGIDELAAAQAALDDVRPYIHSHGGSVDLLGVSDGVVRVKLSGACSGCTASAITLREGIEEALREHYPAFASLEAEEDDAPAHPPPGPTLLQIEGPAAGR